MVFGRASRPTEGVLRSLLTLDNAVPDPSTISRRTARLGKVASYKRRTVTPVHLLIDRSGLAVHAGQWRTPPNARDSRKRHLAVNEQPRDGGGGELTSTRARDASRGASLVGQIERPLASATADAAYATGDVSKTLENHRAHRSPKVLIPPTQGRSARARLRGHATAASSHPSTITCGATEGVRRIGLPQATQGGDDVPPRQGPPGLSDASEGTGVPESRGEVGVHDPEHHDGARDTRWRDDRMTGRRSHGRLSALNGVVHQGSVSPAGAPYAPR